MTSRRTDFEGQDPQRRMLTEAGLESASREGRAVATLREPHPTMARVPNAVRDSIAEVIVDLKKQLRESEQSYQHLLERYRKLRAALTAIKEQVAETEL